MATRIATFFTAHPASVDETYFEHMAFAGRFAFRLFSRPSRPWSTPSCRSSSKRRRAPSCANSTSARTIADADGLGSSGTLPVDLTSRH